MALASSTQQMTHDFFLFWILPIWLKSNKNNNNRNNNNKTWGSLTIIPFKISIVRKKRSDQMISINYGHCAWMPVCIALPNIWGLSVHLLISWWSHVVSWWSHACVCWPARNLGCTTAAVNCTIFLETSNSSNLLCKGLGNVRDAGASI